MGKSKRRHKKSKKQSSSRSPKKLILLERTSVVEIKKFKEFGEYYLRFHSDYYSTLAIQRSQVQNELKKALMEATSRNFEFSEWKRIVRLKYSNKPLSVEGSIKSIGGRFNIGDISSPLVTRFPSLYLAEDFYTAIKEVLSQGEKSADEVYTFALANKESFTSVSLRGRLDFIIDLNKPEKLQTFVDLIKNFTVPDYITLAAKKLNEKIDLIKTAQGLVNALLIHNWRDWPMLFDIPTASQIFGELVANAGIDGILYPSKQTEKNCLAVFPQNFDTPDSYIELEHETAPEVRIKRLDYDIWSKSSTELLGE